jgi:hypothetical protein
MPARLAGICGLVAFVTVNVGWIAGGLAQPAAFSSARDDISDLGAVTADSAWLYNQIGANLTGLLVIAVALGLWRALSPDLLGRLGVGALFVAGLGSFLDGFFRLDCRGIDAACTNHSWHSHAHKIESGFTGAATLAAPLGLGLAFRRAPPGATPGFRASPRSRRSSPPTWRSRRSVTARPPAPGRWSPSSGSPS